MPHRAVALLIETSSGYCRGLLDGIIDYAKHRGDWSIHLNEQERGAAPPAWLRSWDGDGIIARIETDAIGRQLRQLRLPIVDLSAARHLPGIPWADTEDKAIARLAVEHFLDRGYRYFGYCGDAELRWSLSRGEHFRRLAQQAGAEVFEHRVVHRYNPKYRWDRIRTQLGAWLSQLPRPIAIMACNDFQAQLVLDVCRSLSISVPEEVAVLGVDNDRFICELCEPTLSSVIPDTRRTGHEAAELLERMMSGKTTASDTQLVTQPFGVSLRQSTDTIAIDDPAIATSLAYIRRHATQNIRVADVVRRTDLSRRALEHRFVKWVGHTPHEEIQRVKIERIKLLLRQTEHTIHEIAIKTGYDYPEYMAAAFRKQTGQSPSQYREQQKDRPDLS